MPPDLASFGQRPRGAKPCCPARSDEGLQWSVPRPAVAAELFRLSVYSTRKSCFMNLNASNPLKRYPLVFFFILSYGIAWIPLVYRLAIGKDFLTGLSFFAPAISAIIMTVSNEGKTGIQALISRLFFWRANLKWYLIALLAPIVLELLAILTHKLLGDTTPSLHFTDWIQMLEI